MDFNKIKNKLYNYTNNVTSQKQKKRQAGKLLNRLGWLEKQMSKPTRHLYVYGTQENKDPVRNKLIRLRNELGINWNAGELQMIGILTRNIFNRTMDENNYRMLEKGSDRQLCSFIKLQARSRLCY